MVASDTALGDASNLIRFNSNNNTTLGDLRFDGNYTLANNIEFVTGGGGPVNTNGNTAALTGVLSGGYAGGLTKLGGGTLTVSGANTYTGGTNVNAGTLAVNGNNSAATGAVAVASGGTLGGTGTLGGATTVASGGTVRGDSGTGTGTLTTQNVTVASGGKLGVQLGTGTAASSLNTSAGVLNLNSGAIIAPNGPFDGAGDRVLATLSAAPGGLVVGGTTYDADTTAAPIGTYTAQAGDTGLKSLGALQIDVTNLGFGGGEQLVLNRNGSNQLVLSFTPVPEPASLLAACGLAVGGFVAVRKLRRKAHGSAG